MIIKAAMPVASYIAKINPKLDGLLIPCQTPFLAKDASPSNGVYCHAMLFGEFFCLLLCICSRPLHT